MSVELNKILKKIDSKVMKNNFICIDVDVTIYAKVPSVYENLPELPYITGLTLLEEKDVEEFFMDILVDQIHIKSFDGICNDNWFQGCSCDYCHTFSECYLFRRCTVCNLDMCNKCFAMKNEGDKLVERKDYLGECRKHELLTVVFPLDNVCCDVCGKETLSDNLYLNRDDIVYVCIECFNTDKGEELIKKHELTLCKGNKTIQEQIGYGSVFDWVPVYKDEECNMLLYNSVFESDNYGKFSFMSCDENGRYGVSIVRDTDDINDLAEELGDAFHQWMKKYEGGCICDKSSQIPIKQAMIDRNMCIHFG